MSERKQAALWVSILSIIIVLIVWHVINWHSRGMYLEMFKWLLISRGYIAALYNLGLMLALGAALGFLMEKIVDLAGYKVPDIKRFDDGDEGGAGKTK
jgi:hypothetical protein